ncbi:MAG: hypothetical protein Q8Q49_05580, partial [bacterium]|nr:hypothetical protein [bacterium]
MAGKETHRKKTLLRKEESVADAVIRRYKRSGVLQLSDDVPFPEFIQALHRKDAEFDPGTAKNRAVGRLKYDVMANMLGVLPKNQKPTDDLEDPAWITEWV